MKRKSIKSTAAAKPQDHPDLFKSISSLINQSRQKVIVTVNTELLPLYWNIGNMIKKSVLQNKRATYGEQIISSLSRRLTVSYGTGWSKKQLDHCLRVAETLSKKQIVSAVRRQLSWTHVKAIMYLPDNLQREFYFEMAVIERWSTRQLQERIDSMLYERTSISKKPVSLSKKNWQH